ncbi:hypothetical protein G9A89_004665 [Geosiphon pyriformis]|nr:hypothetical protein G9A89_004665 [Geosiphon pyriformis]
MLSRNQRPRIIQQNWRSTMVVHQLISSLSNHTIGSHPRNSENGYNQNQSSQNYLSFLVISKDTLTNNNLETFLKQTINNNISLATITNDELLAAIFFFEIEEPTENPLFSGAALNTKPITAMYINTKVNGQAIKLILDSSLADSIITQQLIDQLDYQVNHTASARIIIADGATKTLIGKIDNFFIEVNDQSHSISHSNAKTIRKSCLPWNLRLCLTKTTRHKLITIANHVTMNTIATQNAKTSRTMNHVSLVANNCSTKGCKTTFLVEKEPVTHCVNTQFFLMTGIYTILKEKEPISSYASESDSTFNPDSNSDNNDNNSSSSIQNGNSNNNDNLNSDSDFEQYIVLLNLPKKQKLRWFSGNDEGIMPECMHNTNTKFDLKYLGKDLIKLESYSYTCIDLKIVLEISTTIIVQLTFRSSLVKKRISIKEKIIDTGYVGNIIAMLQNNSEKAYIIEPKKKIAQAIFLLLIKVAQLVSVKNREELGITAREI